MDRISLPLWFIGHSMERRKKHVFRTHCVETNIQDADAAQNPITAEDLAGLSEVRLRHIIGNVVVSAQAHPHEDTARTVDHEVRMHLAGAELPSLGAVDPGKEKA